MYNAATGASDGKESSAIAAAEPDNGERDFDELVRPRADAADSRPDVAE